MYDVTVDTAIADQRLPHESKQVMREVDVQLTMLRRRKAREAPRGQGPPGGQGPSATRPVTPERRPTTTPVRTSPETPGREAQSPSSKDMLNVIQGMGDSFKSALESMVQQQQADKKGDDEMKEVAPDKFFAVTGLDSRRKPCLLYTS